MVDQGLGTSARLSHTTACFQYESPSDEPSSQLRAMIGESGFVGKPCMSSKDGRYCGVNQNAWTLLPIGPQKKLHDILESGEGIKVMMAGVQQLLETNHRGVAFCMNRLQ